MKPAIQTRVAGLVVFLASLSVLPAGEIEREVNPPPKPVQVVATTLPPPAALDLVRSALRFSPHRWESAATLELARGIDETSRETGMSPGTIVAMILVETHFRPGIVRRNSNGTFDYGLTQQNSRYVQGRCRMLFNRPCTVAELLDPRVSLMLMARTLKTCGRVFRGEARVLCYNSWKRAYRFRRTGARPRYLRKFHFELRRLHPAHA